MSFIKNIFATLSLAFMVVVFGAHSVDAATGFKIEVAKQGTSQATITVTPTTTVDMIGSVSVRKTGNVAVKSFYQQAFQSGTPRTYVIPGLTTNVQYFVSVLAGDLGGNNYTAEAQFTMGTTAASTTPATPDPVVRNPSSSSQVTQQAATPAPGSGQAATPAPGSATDAGFVPKPNTSGQATGFVLDVTLKNPLKVDTIEKAIKFFVNTLIKIAIPFIVVFFIWAGLKFILAQGKPDEITKAKQMFWYTIIGTLLILGAWTITNAIIGTVNSITS